MSAPRTSAALLLAAGLAAPAGVAPAQRAPAASVSVARDSVVLRSGDAVRITVWRSPELSGEFRIAADGTLIHPLYRTVRVVGVALPEVERRLRTFIEQYQTQPQFVAEPLLRVAVGGEIEKPNLYFLRPDVTVAEAVALAGGPTVRGRRDRVRVLADGRVRLIRLDGSDPAGHVPIRSGDQLIVERRGSLFREIVAPVIGVAGAVAAIVNVSRSRR